MPGLRAHSLQLRHFFQGHTWIWESAVCLLGFVGCFLGEHILDTYLCKQHLSQTLPKVLLKKKKSNGLYVLLPKICSVYKNNNKKVCRSRSFVKKCPNNYVSLNKRSSSMNICSPYDRMLHHHQFFFLTWHLGLLWFVLLL